MYPRPVSQRKAIEEAKKIASRKPAASEVLLHRAYQLLKGKKRGTKSV